MLYSSIGFNICIISWTHHHSIIQNSFTALKSYVPPIHSFFCLPLNPWHWSFYCLTWFCLFWMSYSGVIEYVASPELLVSHSNIYLGFLHDFSWLYNFLLLNNILLSGCTTVCLSIHLLEDILDPSKFWQLWKKMPWIFICRILCGYVFHSYG